MKPVSIDSMPSVSVIIVSYKVRYYIEQCLESVLRSVPDAQVLVVDNKSDDGSVEYLRERFPQIEVIANDFNAGFGKANNMALAKAVGRYVLFLNPDTVVAERTIPGCMDYMEAHPEVGEITISGLGVVIGAHCGPGLLTVFYLCDGRRPE